MNKPLTILDCVKIAAPCSVPWTSMHGDDRVRFCDQCKLSVYNLSAMHLDEIETLLREREGRLCIGLCRRTDGTYLTDNCPVGLRALRHGLRRTISAVAAAFAALICATGAIGRNDIDRFETTLRDRQPFAAIADWLWPGSRGVVFGAMAPIPTPPIPPNGSGMPAGGCVAPQVTLAAVPQQIR